MYSLLIEVNQEWAKDSFIVVTAVDKVFLIILIIDLRGNQAKILLCSGLMSQAFAIKAVQKMELDVVV